MNSDSLEHNSKLVRVMDLVGQNISGLKADIRTRYSDGSLRYAHQEMNGAVIVEMDRVEIKYQRTREHIPETKEPWLYWHHRSPAICNYSGVAMSATGGNAWENIYLLMEAR